MQILKRSWCIYRKESSDSNGATVASFMKKKMGSAVREFHSRLVLYNKTVDCAQSQHEMVGSATPNKIATKFQL